jgi:ATP-dependent HslUV protease ATP-binding subunit HslU
MENIVARGLQSVFERLLDQVSFDAPELQEMTVTIDAAYVEDRLNDVLKDEDLSRYVL